MLYETKEFTLKDGRKALLLNPGDDEAQGLIDYLHKSSGETDFLLRIPSECDRYTLEKEKELLTYMKGSDNDLFLTCTVDGKVAGNCHLMMNSQFKMKHRANVAIALLKDYWGLGIGTMMFEEMIRVARESKPELMQLELEVAAPNERAQALYKKMGFVEYGRRENALRCASGDSFMDEILMMKKL
ncbi:MAG: GNAT family N-acetyltransferase [Clostridiales bacterium]|nr:GNAT family N-acetyltransferase [Clostridiales bacterium]